jgi:hypothetical protein
MKKFFHNEYTGNVIIGSADFHDSSGGGHLNLLGDAEVNGHVGR